MAVVDKETAIKEVNSWLDHKKVGEKKRESAKENIESIVDAMQEGVLVLNDDKSLQHNLKFPLEGEITVESLTYKPRITAGAIQLHLQGVKSGDIDGRLLAYGAALAGKPKDLLKKLDTEDMAVLQNITLFFV